jgi:hypothetical protein
VEPTAGTTRGDDVAKTTRAEHYRAIAEFYGRVLAEDINDPRIPDFVLAHSARRAAHFALQAMRLTERRPRRIEAWQAAPDVAPISPASLS